MSNHAQSIMRDAKIFQRRVMQQRDETGAPLPPGPPVVNFTPQEIILVRWSLDRTSSPPNASINQANSGVYSYQLLQHINAVEGKNYLGTGGIQQFAADLANNQLPEGPDSFLHAVENCSQAAGPNDVVIWYQSYVVFALESGSPWFFTKGANQHAMNTKNTQTPSVFYTDLEHYSGGSVYPTVGTNVCTIAYFSAYTAPGQCASNPFNLFATYRPLADLEYVSVNFDPAIKNDGHGGGHGGQGTHAR